MSTQIDCNTYITEEEFSGEFRRHGNVLYDKKGKPLGSVSRKRICDLNGKEIAKCVKEEKITDENDRNARVAEYASETRNFRLVCDKLYLLGKQGEEWLGRVARTERNAVHIALLSVLAFFLIATVILITLIGLPVADGANTLPPEPDDDTVPIINITDDTGAWEDAGAIGMFGSSLRPGSSGQYKFTIHNPHEDKTLNYAFWIEPRYEGGVTVSDFPIKFRIKMNNLIVETEEWRKVEDLKLSELLLLPASEHAFTLEWNWAFEGGNDENDTLIGADGGKISLVLHISAQIKG